MKKVSAHILPNMHDEDYDALMGRYYSPIMKVCYMVAVGGGLDVNDVYQEVAMEIWTHFDTIMSRFRHEAAEETYVISIAINTALDYRSSVERRVRLVPITEQQCAIGVDDSDRDRLEELYTLIRCLNPDDRCLVYLKLQGYSYAEIGEKMNLTETAVGTRFSRIVARLRRLSHVMLGEAKPLNDNNNK